MNIMIKDDSYSPESSERMDFRIEPLLQKLAIKALRSAENVLEQPLLEKVQRSYAEHAEQGAMVGFLEFFIFTLINRVDKLQQLASIDLLRQDYETLETAVQKAEAEIRKHIRIEQQLKIYLDSLEEKVEDLQSKLQTEEGRYAQLFEVAKQNTKTLRDMEEERRELHQRIARAEEGRDRSKPSSNYSTINELPPSKGEQAYKEYLVGRRKGSNKCRNTEKVGRKQGEKREGSKNTHFVDGAIQINLSNNIVVSKKNSYDQHLLKHTHISNDSSIRQLTRTVQMKHPQPQTHADQTRQPQHADKLLRPNRKISKYRTQSGEEGKKEFRSSSVCY